MPRPLVFDLDLTLAKRPTHETWMEVLIGHGLAEAAADIAYRAGVGRAVYITAKAAFPGLAAEEHYKIAAEFIALLDTHPIEEMPGADPVLRRLKKMNHRLCLSTGGTPEMMNKVLTQLDWTGLFTDALASTEDFPKGSAHLEAIRANEFSLEHDGFTIGDGVAEMEHGLEMHIPWRCAYLAAGSHGLDELRQAGANLAVDNLSDLPKLCSAPDPRNTEWYLG